MLPLIIEIQYYRNDHYYYYCVCLCVCVCVCERERDGPDVNSMHMGVWGVGVHVCARTHAWAGGGCMHVCVKSCIAHDALLATNCHHQHL